MSTNSTTTTNTSSGAANYFGDYLTQIAQQARDLYNNGQGNATYDGQVNANWTDALANAYGNQWNFDTGQQSSLNGMLGNATNQSYGGQLQGQVNPWLQQLFNTASGGNNINTYNSYNNVANGAYDMDAATRQAQRDAGNWLINGWQAQNSNNILNNLGWTGGNDNTNTGMGTAALRNVVNQAGGGTAADQYLTQMARGDNQTNPFLQQLLDANATRIGNRAASLSSGAGRYGSAGMYDALNRSIAETNNPLLFQSAEAERQRQLAATQEIGQQRYQAGQLGLNAGTALGQIGQNQTLNQLNAANALSQNNRANIGQYMQAGMNSAALDQMNVANRMAALQGMSNVANMDVNNMTNAANSGLGNIMDQQRAMQGWTQAYNGLFNTADNSYQTQLGLGAYAQNRSQNDLNQQIQNFYAQQMNPWLNLMRYSGALGGLSGFFGNSGTTTSSQSLPFTSALGLGIAGLGTAGSLFGLSDRELKTDIEHIGVDEATGLNIYAYRYKNDPKTYPKVVGPMAQEVAEKYPHLVAKIGGRLVIRL